MPKRLIGWPSSELRPRRARASKRAKEITLMRTLSLILAVTTFLMDGVLPVSSISMSGTRQEKKQGQGSESIVKSRAIERQVTFKTEDGWTIHGTYSVPVVYRQGERLPSALLLHSSVHTQMVWVVYPGWVKIQDSLVTLRIDWR